MGYAEGTNLIENCTVTSTLNVGSDYAGGMLGYCTLGEGQSSGTTIKDCVFAGTIKGYNGNYGNIGGIWGWNDNGATPTLVNCLENGTYTDISSMHHIGLLGSSGTITDCYYVNTQIGEPANACTISGATHVSVSAPGKSYEIYRQVTAADGNAYYPLPAVLVGVRLFDQGDNSEMLTAYNGQQQTVTLADRTLYQDGAWNTICLPFDLVLADSPLDGATARPLSEASISGTTLNLSFGDAVDELTAGTPYIIMWENGNNIVSPTFSGVTIDKTRHDYDTDGETDVTTDQRVRFAGTYASMAFDDEEKSILFMGDGNTLYYPEAGASIQVWHTLDGRRLQGRPTRAGVY